MRGRMGGWPMTFEALRIALFRLGLLTTLLPTAAVAQFTVWGVGNNSCGEWTDAHAGMVTAVTVAEEAWLGGYMTGTDEAALGPRAPKEDFRGLTGWISNYCHANPLDNLATAASALRLELMKRDIPR